MKLRTIFTLVYLIVAITCLGQKEEFKHNHNSKQFIPPFDFQLKLSGSFGELRPNHFHGGIDIKTGGVQGKKVKASASGFIYRIKVSPWGYGNALYIKHDEGFMTVYGHLKSFNENIEEYVKHEQYKAKSYAVDLFPEKELFPVKQGEVIALSGNSGSSAGPHLHFEIREKDGTVCLNPLLHGIEVGDHVQPVMSMLGVYAIGDSSSLGNLNDSKYLPLKKKGGKYILANNQPIRLRGDIAFGISAFDRQDNSNNKNGIYGMKVWVDGQKLYEFFMDAVPFAHNPCINSLIDYPYYMDHKKRLHRTVKDANNHLECITYTYNNGAFSFNDNQLHKVKIELLDYSMNIAELNFDVQSDLSLPVEIQKNRDGVICDYDKPHVLSSKGAKLTIPSMGLFKDELIKLGEPEMKKYWAFPYWKVGDERIAFAKKFTFKLDLSEVPENIREYAYIAKVNSKGKKHFASAKKSKNQLVLRSKKMGVYTIDIDSLPPTIKPVYFYDGKDISKHQIIRVKIGDSKSGISSYEPKLNGEWLLMEYDPKKMQLIYRVDERMKKGENILELTVIDGVGNKSTKKYRLIRS